MPCFLLAQTARRHLHGNLAPRLPMRRVPSATCHALRPPQPPTAAARGHRAAKPAHAPPPRPPTPPHPTLTHTHNCHPAHLRRLLQHLVLCLVLLPAALHEQLQAALALPLMLRVEGMPHLRRGPGGGPPAGDHRQLSGQAQLSSAAADDARALSHRMRGCGGRACRAAELRAAHDHAEARRTACCAAAAAQALCLLALL